MKKTILKKGVLGLFIASLFLVLFLLPIKKGLANDLLPNIYSSFENKANLDQIMTIYYSPVTDLDITLNPQNDKLRFKKGEKIEFNGTVKLMFKKEGLELWKEDCLKGIRDSLNDCTGECPDEATLIKRVCDFPENYSIPFLEDVGIYAQIWRKDTANSEKGDYLIDEFYVMNDLSLEKDKEIPFSLNWKIPKQIAGGEYYVDIYINGSNSFNIQGFTFGPGSKAFSHNFEVEEGGSKGVELDKDNIKLNGKEYNYRMLVPRIENKKIKVEIPVKNLNSQEEKVNVMYELYKWSQENPADLMKDEKEVINVPAEGSKTITYEDEVSGNHGTYSLRITVQNEEGISRSNVRFTINGENKGIFRFLGLTESDDNKWHPMFCPRNAQWDGGFDGNVNIDILDDKNNKVGNWNSKGLIRVITTCFVMKDLDLSGNDYIKLVGNISDTNGNVTDHKEVVYNFTEGEVFQEETKDSQSTKILMLFIVLLLVVGVTILYISRRKEIVNK